MEKELIERLSEIDDIYEGFAEGITRDCKRYDRGVEKLLAKIKKNPQMTTSDVIEFVTEEIFGIKKVYPPIEQGA